MQVMKDTGVHVVVSAGNDPNQKFLGSPARVEDVISVGALNNKDHTAHYSSNKLEATFWAPGDDIPTAKAHPESESTESRSSGTRHVTRPPVRFDSVLPYRPD